MKLNTVKRVEVRASRVAGKVRGNSHPNKFLLVLMEQD